MLLGARKLMTGRNQLLFVTSAGQGLAASSDHIHFGLPLALGFALLPPTHDAHPALPARYSVAPKRDCSRRQGRAAAVLEHEAIGFSRVFTLSKHCSHGLPAGSTSSRRGSSRSCATPAAAVDSATAAEQQAEAAPNQSSNNITDALKQQLERQCALQQQQQPWLGANLDIAGFTKKGFMRGGGKEQNQDRGLIMQRFRSSAELLLGVMDGHGTYGHLVSTYLIQHLPAVLMQHLVSAAAAVTAQGGSSSNWQQQQQHALKKQKGGKHNKQQQQAPLKPIQQLQPDMFGSHQLQFVVMPDHHGDLNLGQHGGSSSSSASYSGNLSGPWAALAEASKQQGAKTTRHGRAVGKNKIAPQPELSSSSSSMPGAVAVPEHIVAQVPLTASLLNAVFAETDHMLIGSGINTLDSGSTAVLCHVGHDSITTAWVGDSRAVVGRKVAETGGLSLRVRQQPESSSSSKWQAIQLSDDHKPERPDEQLRIILNEGRVQQMSNASGQGLGPFRVWFKEIDYPGLAMSRAFGDTPCRRIGVTVEPELYIHRLTEADQLLVAATDGVWEYMTNEEVIQVAASCSTAEAAARKVVEVAEQRWRSVDGGGYVDDITAVVVRATPRQASSRL